MSNAASSDQRTIPCPICQKKVTRAQAGAAFPFCGPKCKSVDLYRWMTGQYGLDPASGTLDRFDPDEAEDVSEHFRKH